MNISKFPDAIRNSIIEAAEKGEINAAKTVERSSQRADNNFKLRDIVLKHNTMNESGLGLVVKEFSALCIDMLASGQKGRQYLNKVQEKACSVLGNALKPKA